VGPSGRAGLLLVLAAAVLVVILPGCGRVGDVPRIPPTDPTCDTDKDRIPDSSDADDGNDGTPDVMDPFPAKDGAAGNPAFQPRSVIPLPDTAVLPVV